MFTQAELQELQAITSLARLSSYGRYLGTNTAAEAYGAYMWSIAVSTSFSPLIQTIEICLRNALNDTLAPHYGPGWFEHWVNLEANHLRARGKLHGQSEGERLIAKAKDKIRKRDQAERQRNGLGPLPAGYTPGWQSVLAELTFGFWVRFLARWYWDINHKARLWPNHVITAFPGAPATMHAVGALHRSFSDVLDMRNRIHHQEPLWKHHTVANIDDAIQYLSGHLTDCLHKLDYLGRGQRQALQKYGVLAAIEEVCSKESFYRFIGRAHGKNLLLRSAKRSLRLVEKNLKDHQCIWIVSDGSRPQLVLRNSKRRFF